MNSVGLLVACLALVVGVLAGLVIGTWNARRPRDPDPNLLIESTGPQVPDGVLDMLRVLQSSGLVIGPHDEVLEATVSARNLGLARGSRIIVPKILDLVRSSRRDLDVRDADVKISRGARSTATYLHVRVAPLTDQLILVLADDYTSERRIEQTRRDFVANISHELKTPIGAMSLLAEAVEDAADDPPAVRRFASRMGIESARLTDLVGQIIELSRLQGDNPLEAAEVVDVDEVVSDAVDRCRVDADQHEVTIAVAGARGCQVIGSSRQLGVAIGNLVENAVIYSDEGARVVVAAHAVTRGDDQYVEITVSDTGIGIAPEDTRRIFERFYRVDYARSRANGGTGLGLSIVKHIAASHGGEVSVWSRPGQGSTFTVRIPAYLPTDITGADDGDDPVAGGLATPQAAQRIRASAAGSSPTRD